VTRGVLLVGPLPPPTGGVATHLHELSRALEALGARVSIADSRQRGFLARLARARLRDDVVHVHTNGHNHGSWRLALVCGGGRSILTLHSGLAPPYIAQHRRKVAAVARRYARIVAVSPELARALAKAGVDSDRVVISPAFTPRALDFRLAPPGLASLRARHRPLVTCALAPGPEYGAATILDAFAQLHARLPAAGLLLFGPGTRALAPEIARRHLRQSVALLGELPRARSLAVIAAGDIFVRPTLADGDAVSVREALALGRTVVASDAAARPAGALIFAAASAAACAELLFRAASTSIIQPVATPDDCLIPLVEIYRRIGAVPVGTALAI
jgi:glycosyltransferase involved in cell wall biosynthesis